MKNELDKNSNLWYNVVTPIRKGNNKIMYRKTLQELISFFDNQIRVCCEYADNSECEDEFEFWRAERFTMRAYKNYIRFCVL